MSFEQFAIAEEQSGAFDGRSLGPLRQSRRGGADGFVDLVGARKRHTGDHLADRRVVDGARAVTAGWFPTSGDQHRDGLGNRTGSRCRRHRNLRKVITTEYTESTEKLIPLFPCIPCVPW